MTEAPERIWVLPDFAQELADKPRYTRQAEYIRADIARPMTVAEAAKVLLAEWVDHGEGLLGGLVCYEQCSEDGMQPFIDGNWVKFTDIEADLRALSQGGE